jgi:hypothetical protein
MMATAAIPALANPTTLNFTGSVDNVTNLTDPAFPVSEGDSLSGSVSVNVGANGNFTSSDLQSFDLFVGSSEFNLDSSDFASFSGTVSGSSLTAFELATFFGVNSGADNLALGFNGVGQPFSVTSGAGAIATGAYTVAVSGAPTAVPEPPAWGWLALGLMVIGLALGRRRLKTTRAS